jgi:hypothetical protein
LGNVEAVERIEIVGKAAVMVTVLEGADCASDEIASVPVAREPVATEFWMEVGASVNC